MVDGPSQRDDEGTTKAHERRRLVRRLGGAGLLVLGLLWVYVFWVPVWMYPSLTDSDLKDVKTAQNELDAAKVQELKDARLKLQNDARTTLLQGLGAVLVLTGAGIGAAVTLRQVQATTTPVRSSGLMCYTSMAPNWNECCRTDGPSAPTPPTPTAARWSWSSAPTTWPKLRAHARPGAALD